MSSDKVLDRPYGCDTEKPFVFVSYSHKDKEIVWRDICKLQEQGYNIWIDCDNLHETDDTWQKALKIIDDIECQLLLFYISRNSVCSEACLKELEHSRSEETIKIHNGTLPLVIIEAEGIKNINDFRANVHSEIRESNYPKEQKKKMAITLGTLMDNFVPDDKLRITYTGESYNEKIEKNIRDAGIERLSEEELFDAAMNMFSKASQYESAKKIITNLSYEPARLLLFYMYLEENKKESNTGDNTNTYESNNIDSDSHIWDSVDIIGHKYIYNDCYIFEPSDSDISSIFSNDSEILPYSILKGTEIYSKYGDDIGKIEPSSLLIDKGFEYKNEGKYTIATAYFLACGIWCKSAEAYLEASRMWMNLTNPSYEMAIQSAKSASELRSKEGKRLYNGLRKMSKSKFVEICKQVNDKRFYYE